jgi:UDP-2,4-diacetamido-2,4,6-trideoxy-beta-L-altropyranose hydrolase
MGDAFCSEGYDSWLGSSQDEDASQTIEAIQGLNAGKPDWMVVDHYAIDSRWEMRISPYVERIFVIDDLANRFHSCDMLLDQNYRDKGALSYKALVPDTCQLLIGPRYALLGPEFAAHRQTPLVRDRKINKILVFFGGTDPHNMTGLVLEALTCEEFGYLEVDVVVGANNQHLSAIQEQINQRLRTTLYGPLPHLADLMMKADLAFGAGGTTTWERMALGLSCLVITIADNQISTAELLNKNDFIRLIGNSQDANVTSLREVLRDEIDMCRYKYRAELGMKLCDAMGVTRVVDEVLVTR